MRMPVPIPNSATRLNHLLPGQCAVIRSVESESEDIQRLKMLGVCIGRRVEMVKAGDPLIIRIFSSRIGISASLAASVWLEVCIPEYCVLSAAS